MTADHCAHLTPDEIAAFADGEVTPAGMLETVLARLDASCSSCRTALAAYDRRSVLDRAFKGYRAEAAAALDGMLRLREERDEAGALLDELLALPDESLLLGRLAENPRFQTWGLAALLVDEAYAAFAESAPAALGTAEMAVLVADRLAGHYPGKLVADTRCIARVALVWAHLASGNLPAARQAVAAAEASRREGGGRRLYRADVGLARSALLLALRRPEEAAAPMSWIGDWAVDHDLPELAARATLAEAGIARARGEMASAALLLTGVVEGLRAADLEPAIESQARLELAATLAAYGLHDAAWQELGKLRVLFPGAGRVAQARRSAVAGTALIGQGRDAEADAALDEAWRGLAGHGYVPEAARVAAALVAHRVRTGGAVRHVLDEMVALFEAPTLTPAAGGAILAFQVHAREAETSAELARLASTLSRALPYALPPIPG